MGLLLNAQGCDGCTVWPRWPTSLFLGYKWRWLWVLYMCVWVYMWVCMCVREKEKGVVAHPFWPVYAFLHILCLRQVRSFSRTVDHCCRSKENKTCRSNIMMHSRENNVKNANSAQRFEILRTIWALNCGLVYFCIKSVVWKQFALTISSIGLIWFALGPEL